MSFKLVVFIALLAVANAGVVGPAYATYGAPSVAVASPTITSQASNTFRSFGNLGQVSTYQKTIDTPYSSVRKYDTRVSNDALAYPAIAKTAIATPAVGAYHGYAAPAVAAYPGYAAPAFAKTAIAAPAVAAYHGYAAPAFAKTAIAAPAVAAYPGYAAPAFAKTAIAAPAVAAYPGYAAPAFAKTAIAAPAVAGYHGYAAPAVKTAVATPHGGLLGVAYSAAPTVAHMTFQGYGVNYAY